MTKILVIDDDDSIREYMKTLLELEGYIAHEAKNGLHGIELAMELQPDIILMDMHMPLMSGMVAIRTLRESRKYIYPIIAVTANASIAEVRQIIDIGCDGFIPKPISNNFTQLLKPFIKK
ncbi:response regulator [Patescibacteria group bacterium]|nr:response regulator [Patescibacteria group bacterium]